MNSNSCPINFAVGENTPPDPKSNVFQHFLSALRRFAIFRGRATRKEYWSFVLIMGVISGVLNMILESMQVSAGEAYVVEAIKNGDAELVQAVLDNTVTMFSLGFTCIALSFLRFLVIFVCYIPVIAVLVRRSHDVGKSGKIAVITMALMLFYMFCMCFSAMTTLGAIMMLISGIGNLYILFAIVFRDSQKGENQYGPSTKYPE